MRILLVNKFYYLKGGSERYFFDLKRLLEQKGHEVIVWSMKSEKNLSSPYEKYFVSEVSFNTQGLILKARGASRIFYSFEAKRKIEQLIKDTKPDLVHLHNIAHQISPSILPVFKKYNLPVVQTLHDYKLICPNYLLYHQKICEECKSKNYHQAVKNKCVKKSTSKSLLVCLEMYFHKFLKIYEKNINVFISPSRFLKDKIDDWKVVNNRIVHLPNFISLKGLEPQYESGDYLLYFGRISREKGLLTLIKAIGELKHVNLKIVGHGPMLNEVRDLTKAKNWSNITYLDHQDFDQLKELIRQARIVVLPSEWYENMPYTILESFALGKPVIGANLGGIPELVVPNQTGLLFEAGDIEDLKKHIKQVWDQPEKITQMGQQARKLVEDKYNQDIHYQDLFNIYKSVHKGSLT